MIWFCSLKDVFFALFLHIGKNIYQHGMLIDSFLWSVALFVIKQNKDFAWHTPREQFNLRHYILKGGSLVREI
jgi:hypothetical protein